MAKYPNNSDGMKIKKRELVLLNGALESSFNVLSGLFC